MKINPKSLFLILNLSKSPKISRFRTKKSKFCGFKRFPWQFPYHFRGTIPISDRPYSKRMIRILENHKMWKRDLSRNLLNLSRTSWNRILALNLTLFDPLTLWESTRILSESSSARNYVDLKKMEKLDLNHFVPKNDPFFPIPTFLLPFLNSL